MTSLEAARGAQLLSAISAFCIERTVTDNMAALSFSIMVIGGEHY